MAQSLEIGIAAAVHKLNEILQSDLTRGIESSLHLATKLKSLNLQGTKEQLIHFSTLLFNLQSLQWKQKSALLTTEALLDYLIKIVQMTQMTPSVETKKPRKHKSKKENVKIPEKQPDMLAQAIEASDLLATSQLDFQPCDYNYPSFTMQYQTN